MEAAPVQKKSFIKGTQPLWKAFWLLYVVSGFAFTISAIMFMKIPAVNYALNKSQRNRWSASADHPNIYCHHACGNAYCIFYIYINFCLAMLK